MRGVGADECENDERTLVTLKTIDVANADVKKSRLDREAVRRAALARAELTPKSTERASLGFVHGDDDDFRGDSAV